MVVNINQNPAFFDETLNVLKFSALAQKVHLNLNSEILLSNSVCNSLRGRVLCSYLSRWW